MTIVIKNPTPDMLDDEGKVCTGLRTVLIVDVQAGTVEQAEAPPCEDEGFESWASCGMCGWETVRPIVEPADG